MRTRTFRKVTNWTTPSRRHRPKVLMLSLPLLLFVSVKNTVGLVSKVNNTSPNVLRREVLEPMEMEQNSLEDVLLPAETELTLSEKCKGYDLRSRTGKKNNMRSMGVWPTIN